MAAQRQLRIKIRNVPRVTRAELERAVAQQLAPARFVLDYKDRRSHAFVLLGAARAGDLARCREALGSISMRGRTLEACEAGAAPARADVVDRVTPLHGVEYAEQLAGKGREVSAYVARVFPGYAPRAPLEVLASPAVSGYRNKCEFTFGLLGETGEPGLGFRAGRYIDSPNHVACVSRCTHNVSDAMRAIVAEICRAVRGTEGVVYDRVEGSGYLKVLMLREIGGDVVGVVQAEDRAGADAEGWQRCLEVVEAFPIPHLYVQTNSRALEGFKDAENMRRIRGKGEYHETLLGRRFRVSPLSFFQVNVRAAEVLYSSMAARVGAGATLLDLCCGTGTIGICVGARCAAVYGVDSEECAVLDAVHNSKANGAAHCEYVCGSVEAALPGILRRVRGGDSVVAVLDPPRAGVPKKLVKLLCDTAQVSELLYVCCNYKAVEHNLRGLAAAFFLHDVWCVDMFPHTAQVEVVFHLKRGRSDSAGATQ